MTDSLRILRGANRTPNMHTAKSLTRLHLQDEHDLRLLNVCEIILVILIGRSGLTVQLLLSFKVVGDRKERDLFLDRRPSGGNPAGHGGIMFTYLPPSEPPSPGSN
jgi:hypothetical protein